MGQNIIGTTTTLIDRTSNAGYIYIGNAFVNNNVAPATDKEIWQITRITLDGSGKAIEIKNAHANGHEGQFFKWDDRTSLNYI